MNKLFLLQPVFFILFLSPLISCREKHKTPSKESINEMDLKRGAVIACGFPDKKLGSVAFEMSCSGETEDFNLAMELLHSFEYDEAEKVFAKIIDKEPDCAMAYWGVAMSNFHPLWAPPSEPELKKGTQAIKIAQAITKKSKREEAYINAIAAFYDDWDKIDHYSRCLRFEKAMEKLRTEYSTDKEAAIFYALALDAAAAPTDSSLDRQKKAGEILNALYPAEPDHPGIIHYIIHTYDYPQLAQMALPAARKYASVAPSSAHALHMPSHIFTRLGLWDECIQSNLASVASGRCYAEAAGIKGHWDEELHGMDYLMYAYLQKGENQLAKQQWDYLNEINAVYPINFKVAYAFAAIPSRYVLENKSWKEAANLQMHYSNFPWKDFQWQEAIVHFARLIGFVHIGNRDAAKAELKELNLIHDRLVEQKDTYKAGQVQIQIGTSEAWLRFKEGMNKEALMLMNQAADAEDKTVKHPVTPCEVIPARELLGDLLLQMNKPGEALEAYEMDLKKHPNRFNGLYGAGLAAERAGDPQKAGMYYRQLLSMVNPAGSARPELIPAKQFLNRHSTR
jgi:tetratricopeptide (TPR) repeat protein